MSEMASRAADAVDYEGRALHHLDPVWFRIRREAEALALAEPALGGFVHATILNHTRMEDATSFHLAQKLDSMTMPALLLRQVFDEAMATDSEIGAAQRADIVAVYDRDPATQRYIEPFLYFKGYQALQAYRMAHWLWQHDRRDMALFLQSRISEQFAVDIHPASRIGRGVMIDHASGVVIGETAVVEDDVSMLHGVTLGGTGKEIGDRHPKIRRGALISVGASVLGNIEVGAYAKVGAASVVLKDVPARTTVAGIPARVVGSVGTAARPSHEMDHRFAAEMLDYSI